MTTGTREHEERGHSAKYLVLIFLVCVATCGVFFSLGFLVGYNERASRSIPSTEVVTGPAAVPPTINSPPESVPVTPQNPSGQHAPPNPASESGTLPGNPAANPATPAAPAGTLLPEKQAGISAADQSRGGGTAPNPPSTVPAGAGLPAQAVPVPPAGEALNRTVQSEVGQGITVQVGALRTKEDAEALVNILKAQGYPVFLVTPEYAHAEDNLFRVQVGPFKTREDADKVRAKLAQEGFKPFIRH